MSTEYASSKLTKVYKYRKAVKLEFQDRKVVLPDDEKRKIEVYWEQARKKNDTLFNGDVLTIEKIDHFEDGICIYISLTDYAHLTYIMNHSGEEITGCKSVAAGGLLITKDGYILLGQMGEKTSFPGIIQCIGGGISKQDIFGKESPINTVIRECFEETGVLLEEKAVMQSERYIYIRDKMTTLGFCYVVNLNFSKEEILEIFENAKKTDDEISKLIFIKNDKNEIRKICEKCKLVDYLESVLFDYVGLSKVLEIKNL